MNITQSDSSYIKLSRQNVTDDQQNVQFDEENPDFSKLPILNNVLLPDSFDETLGTEN